MLFSFLSLDDVDQIAQFERKVYAYDDEYVERKILPIEAWNKDEIISVCKQRNVRAFYVKDSQKIRGWLCYKLQGVSCEILKISIDDREDNYEVFSSLITILKEKVVDSLEKITIFHNVKEDKIEIMKYFGKAGFKVKLIKKKDEDDIDNLDIFEYSLVT